MSLLAELVRGLYETIRETLPTEERDVGPFIAGLCYGLLIYLCVLLLASWGTIAAIGH